MVCLYNPDFKAPLNSVLSNDEYHSNGTEPILFNFPFNNLSSKVEYQVMELLPIVFNFPLYASSSTEL